MKGDATASPWSSEPAIRPTLEALDTLIDAIDPLKPDLLPDDPVDVGLLALSGRSIVNRVDDVFALLRDGSGATVAGALARGLLEQALSSQWIAAEVPRQQAPNQSLAYERARLTELVETRHLSVPNMMRWLRPFPLREREANPGDLGLPSWQPSDNRRMAGTIESIIAVPAAVADLLAMCAHANYAGSMSSVRPLPHAVGFEATAPYAALFAQVAGCSAVAAAQNQGWASERPSSLTTAVIQSASGVHMLPRPTLAPTELRHEGERHRKVMGPPPWLPPSVVLDPLLDEVLEKSKVMLALLREAPNPYSGDAAVPINLTAALPYLTGIGTAEVAILGGFAQFSGAATATAARMLLEEAGRQTWQGKAVGDDGLWERYVAVADGATQGRSLLRARLAESGASASALSELFDVLPDAPRLAVDTRRTPAHLRAPRAPGPAALLSELGVGFAEPGWLELAYSLLSQVTHATPLGDMHLAARPSLGDGPSTMSHEMTALAVDCACLGAAVLLPPLAAILAGTLGLGDVSAWVRAISVAAADVHRAATMVHFLD